MISTQPGIVNHYIGLSTVRAVSSILRSYLASREYLFSLSFAGNYRGALIFTPERFDSNTNKDQDRISPH